ncbi:hypothetical protein ES705_50920 [subsurface metagenome]
MVVIIYRLPDDRFEIFIKSPRLDDVPVNFSLVNCRKHGVYLRVSRQDKPDDVGILLLDDLKKLQSGHLGHIHIAYNYVHFLGFEDFKRFFAAAGEKLFVWLVRKFLSETPSLYFIIVNK